VTSEFSDIDVSGTRSRLIKARAEITCGDVGPVTIGHSIIKVLFRAGVDESEKHFLTFNQRKKEAMGVARRVHFWYLELIPRKASRTRSTSASVIPGYIGNEIQRLK
jgi:hypothetical protein